MTTMKKLIPVFLLCLGMAASCAKEGVDININDPQHIEFIQIIDTALLNAFEEKNIHFGHTPPYFDSLSFVVDSMEYVVCNRYKYHPITHEPVPSTYNGPGDFDASIYYHSFYNHQGNISSHTLLSIGTGGEEDTYKRNNDKVYVIGSGDSFSAYYEEQPDMPYQPTYGILVSGTLAYEIDTSYSGQDTIVNKTLVGVKDYRIGKMIMGYGQTPPYNAPVYLKGSVEVKQHLRKLAPCFDPKTDPVWQQYN